MLIFQGQKNTCHPKTTLFTARIMLFYKEYSASGHHGKPTPIFYPLFRRYMLNYNGLTHPEKSIEDRDIRRKWRVPSLLPLNSTATMIATGKDTDIILCCLSSSHLHYVSGTRDRNLLFRSPSNDSYTYRLSPCTSLLSAHILSIWDQKPGYLRHGWYFCQKDFGLCHCWWGVLQVRS